MNKTVLFVLIVWVTVIGWFIAMKLDGYVDWGWMWVLAPVWIPIALFAIVFFAVLWCIGGLAEDEDDCI